MMKLCFVCIKLLRGEKGKIEDMEDIERKVEMNIENLIWNSRKGNGAMNEEQREQKEIEDMVKLLDTFASSDDSRLKIKMSDELEEGQTQRVYHHGRCDIGSPWACGNAFDAQTEK